MFGSNDDKKNPAAAGEKKGLFGWLRRKPQETVVEQPAPAPEIIPETLVEATPVEVEAAPEVVVVAAEPAVELAAEPAPWPHLPVAEEPVALVEDVQAPHIVPPIPEPEPVVEALAVVETVVEPEP
ncbi:MAG: signal recognition particle-docking protein FtsY, partial [Pseudomonas sp.]|nr:signal recognition particle-docking protein FtsY [Pseudomonas sp.]